MTGRKGRQRTGSCRSCRAGRIQRSRKALRSSSIGNYPVLRSTVRAMTSSRARPIWITPGSGQFVLVNLFREPLGAPMRPGALNELLSALSRRAGLAREVHPHMLRHGFGSNVMDVGGHWTRRRPCWGMLPRASTQVYLHPEYGRLRSAVDQVAAWPVPEISAPGAGQAPRSPAVTKS